MNASTGSSLRILLVDDEPDITMTVKQGLEGRGFKVDAYNQPVEVPLDKARDYDGALLDIKMPEISGFQLARLLWKYYNDLRICFFSAFEINEKEAELVLPNLNSHCFLKKPMSVGALAEHLRSQFARPNENQA